MKRFLVLCLSVILLFTSVTTVNAAGLNPPVSDLSTGVYYTTSQLSIRLRAYPGATIIYTTNGKTPKATINLLGKISITEGKIYTKPISISNSTTIQTIALKRFYPVSAVAKYSYEIYNPVKLENTVKQKFYKFNYSSYASTITYTANNGKKGSFAKTYPGIQTGTVNCTWYTFVHLKSSTGREFLFDIPGGADGKNWYAKAIASSHQIKYSGNNGLEDLIHNNSNRPIYNIVVSFERNGSGTNGHVMMIDAIINGKLYYSDNTAPGVLRTSNSVSEFKNKYSGGNGKILGVVHIK